MTPYFVRIATVDDSMQIASLLSSLGHDTTNDQVRRNWQNFTSTGNLAHVAATPEGKLVGVITLHQMTVLHRPKPVGRITALYVMDAFRNRGIGRTLVGSAETELRKRGCGVLEITSNFRLSKAHAFYEQLGYCRTSFRLAKTLTESEEYGMANNAVNRSGEVGRF